MQDNMFQMLEINSSAYWTCSLPTRCSDSYKELKGGQEVRHKQETQKGSKKGRKPKIKEIKGKIITEGGKEEVKKKRSKEEVVFHHTGRKERQTGGEEGNCFGEVNQKLLANLKKG